MNLCKAQQKISKHDGKKRRQQKQVEMYRARELGWNALLPPGWLAGVARGKGWARLC